MIPLFHHPVSRTRIHPWASGPNAMWPKCLKPESRRGSTAHGRFFHLIGGRGIMTGVCSPSFPSGPGLTPSCDRSRRGSGCKEPNRLLFDDLVGGSDP